MDTPKTTTKKTLTVITKRVYHIDPKTSKITKPRAEKKKKQPKRPAVVPIATTINNAKRMRIKKVPKVARRA